MAESPFRSSNPSLSRRLLQSIPRELDENRASTLDGVIHKTGFSLLLVLAGAAVTWQAFAQQQMDMVMGGMLAGLFGGLVLALIIIFKKEWGAVIVPLYALAEGLTLGGISAMAAAQFHGIVFQAVGLTFGVLFVLLACYKLGLVRASEGFTRGIIAATGAIFMVYLVDMVLNIFHHSVPGIASNGAVGIGFSLVVVAIAALNLVLDFDLVEETVEAKVPKYMEWYCAFSLMVTLIWLYMEILRLLSKLNSRK